MVRTRGLTTRTATAWTKGATAKVQEPQGIKTVVLVPDASYVVFLRGARLRKPTERRGRNTNSPRFLLFFAGQRRQFGRTIWKKYPEQKKDHESVAQNIQQEEENHFRDEVVRISPRNPFEESLEESLHQVSASIRQVRDRPVDTDRSQHDGEEGDENSAKNGIPDQLSTHVAHNNRPSFQAGQVPANPLRKSSTRTNSSTGPTTNPVR